MIQLDPARPGSRRAALFPVSWTDAGFDLTAFYSSHASAIDFLIFFTIFVGLAQGTIGRRFTGRGGRLLSVGVGVALAFSFMLAERRSERTLADLGPVAALILVVVLSVLLFRFLRSCHVPIGSALALTALLAIATSSSISPDLLVATGPIAPMLAMVATVWLFTSILRIAPLGLFKGRGLPVGPLPGPALERGGQVRRIFRNRLATEGRAIETKLEPIVRETVRGGAAILVDLKKISTWIHKHGHDPAACRTIADRLLRVLPRQHQLELDLAGVRQTIRDLLEMNIKALPKELGATLKGLDRDQKKALREFLRDEAGKDHLEERLARYERLLELHLQSSSRLIADAAAALRTSQLSEAVAALEQAIRLEEGALTLAKDVEKVEKLLRKWVRQGSKRV